MDAMPLVKDYMTETAVSLAPEGDAFEALDLLVKKKVTGIPVIDGEGRGHRIVHAVLRRHQAGQQGRADR